MNEWFRFYTNAIHNAKVLRLTDEQFRAWVTLLCLASDNDGALPATDEIAAVLRMKPAKVASWIAALVSIKLLDRAGDGYTPRNWDKRQYKSDVTDPTAAGRMKRYRSNKRNATVTDDRNDRNATVTLIRPEQNRADNRTDTEARGVSQETELQVSIVKAFEAASSPNLPDTTRCALWLSQGYDPSIILSVVSEIVRKKPSIASLNYFDTPIKEAHAVKDAPKQGYVGKPEPMSVEEAVKQYAKIRVWPRNAPCGEPGLSTCTAHPELLAKYGLAPDGQRIAPEIKLQSMSS